MMGIVAGMVRFREVVHFTVATPYEKRRQILTMCNVSPLGFNVISLLSLISLQCFFTSLHLLPYIFNSSFTCVDHGGMC